MIQRSATYGLSSLAKRRICSFIVALLSVPAGAQDFPNGWRRPTATEASSDWRKKSPTKFLAVKGDFDGDGKPNVAELLINPSSSRLALFAKLSSTGQWLQLSGPLDVAALDRFGVDLVRPGEYKTACGKGYGDYACAHGEPDVLKLSKPAIDLFYTESADSIFYWNRDKKKFIEIQMSD